jgi:cysteinyl-tRNA synthetase
MPGDPRNPFRFIEAALTEAKQKIEKMKSTPQILESLPDEEKKKKYLKAENKLLRENLKRMSDNVNVLIEKMNQES